jgi:elongation factor P--(R)-beta-lysine ligase
VASILTFFREKPLMTAPSPWWNAKTHADRRPVLLARGRVKAAIRAWFEGQGFVEVETGCLQVSPGNETHLHAFKTELTGTDLQRRDLYLHTSPEFAMKKLLAAGEEKIFSFAPVFRNRERGALHSPEFTMLEWYRAGAPYETLWEDCAAILKIAAEQTQHHQWTFRGRTCDALDEPERISIDNAFANIAGVDLAETYSALGGDMIKLAGNARRAGISFTDDESWGDLFSRILTERIETKLGLQHPTILDHYPSILSSLSRRVNGWSKHAERFELYCCGIELANGFGELTEPFQQRQRLEEEMELKQRIYGERYPIDEDFLSALGHMPPASGCALGFDRLVMLATGAERIDQVIWTPLSESGK